MSSNKTLIRKYQSDLESRIDKGDVSLVCKDEKLYKDVELLLNVNNDQNILKIDGFKSLTVIENSLHKLPFKTGRSALEKLRKAFEVLEMAALNLYLYPWRKEYRSIKMFSGTFTHFIKPALTQRQSRELFGLLGYSSRHQEEEEDELVLDAKPVPSDILLGLACAFFVSGVECRLFLSTLDSVDVSVESTLHLIKERQKGHSLHVALENAKRKMEAVHASDLDLYTDENQPPADDAHDVLLKSSPPRSLSTRSNETFRSNNHLYGEPSSQSERVNDDKEGVRYVTRLRPQMNNTQTYTSPPQSPGLTETCNCMMTSSLFKYICDQCQIIHYRDCNYFKSCEAKNHTLTLSDVGEQEEKNTRLSDGKLNNHHCMEQPTSDIFAVCHSCMLIHDQSCITVRLCLSRHHNVQNTGRLQPSQVNPPEKHVCLRVSDAPVYVICSICNDAHDCLCKDVKKCNDDRHEVRYLMKDEDSEKHNTPLEIHQCCAANQSTKIACLICKVFHASLCSENWHCTLNHRIHHLKDICATCFSHDVLVLCRFCCLQYCKTCWFKDPMLCKCGKPFLNYSSV